MMDMDMLLMDKARAAMKNAYAPYSKYRVGACVLAKDGRMFSGCNVENASFGMTICAERNAIFAAITAGAREFECIAICADGSLPWPCGACRQVLREFSPDIRVIVRGKNDKSEQTTLTHLLPNSFGPDSL